VPRVTGGRRTRPPVQSVVSVSWLGREFPLHASSPGKIVLAPLDPGDFDRFLAEPRQALTERTITDESALRQELARVRASGIAASDQEFERGCVGFSAAVTDWAGRPPSSASQAPVSGCAETASLCVMGWSSGVRRCRRCVRAPWRWRLGGERRPDRRKEVRHGLDGSRHYGRGHA